jgi:hypothetical protein
LSERGQESRHASTTSRRENLQDEQRQATVLMFRPSACTDPNLSKERQAPRLAVARSSLNQHHRRSVLPRGTLRLIALGAQGPVGDDRVCRRVSAPSSRERHLAVGGRRILRDDKRRRLVRLNEAAKRQPRQASAVGSMPDAVASGKSLEPATSSGGGQRPRPGQAGRMPNPQLLHRIRQAVPQPLRTGVDRGDMASTGANSARGAALPLRRR